MNQLTEQITKAQLTANMLRADILQAYQAANAIVRPEGRNVADNALTEYLSECIEMATRLENKLQALTN